MPRRCTVCVSDARREIDASLARPGAEYRTIAHAHALSPDAVRRHALAHLPAAVVDAEEADERTHGERLIAELARLQTSAADMLARGEASADERTVASALRECRACLELAAKLLGVLSPGGAVAVATAAVFGAVPTNPSDEQIAWASAVVEAAIAQLEGDRGR